MIVENKIYLSILNFFMSLSLKTLIDFPQREINRIIKYPTPLPGLF